MRGLRIMGAVLGAALLGCGDPPTTDARGYTKAPLERAQLVIEGEGSSAMDSLGSPILPRDTLIPPPPPSGTTTQ